MCGRFSFAPLARIIEERFDIRVDPGRYRPRYNCAPSQNLAVISNQQSGELSFFRWGLIPFWAKDQTIGNRMINAKAETLFEKPSFRQIIRSRRCLIPADGFFEWKQVSPKEKIPYRITMNDDSLFALAGIWDEWNDPRGGLIRSFSIITTVPNDLMTGIHDRMPVILRREDEKKWLGHLEQEEITYLLKPYPAINMRVFPVSKQVNNPGNDNREVIMPV